MEPSLPHLGTCAVEEHQIVPNSLTVSVALEEEGGGGGWGRGKASKRW
jgi:hypothetical protein